jgi:hypothetical protein
MQSVIKQVESKTTSSGKTFYVVHFDGGKESSWDAKFVGTEGKTVDFEVVTKGDFKNLKFVKVIEGTQVAPASAPAEPVQKGPSDRLLSIRLECVKLAIQTRDLADVAPDQVGFSKMIAIAEKYFGYIVNGVAKQE